VNVALTREQIKGLPDLPHPQAPVDGKTFEQTWAAVEKWAAVPPN